MHLAPIANTRRFSRMFSSTRTSLAFLSLALALPSVARAQSYIFTTFAGQNNHASTDGTGVAAQFGKPGTIVMDASGNFYIADYSSNTIRKVTPAGVVTTFAGTANSAKITTDGTGTAASFGGPAGLAIDSSGNLYVCEYDDCTIRKITPTGVVTTLAGPSGALNLANYNSIDGTGSAARFNQPTALALDASNNLYVADNGNHTIRKVTPAGVVTTFVGAAGAIGTADGTGSAARFNEPTGIAFDSAGNLFVADSANGCIRKVTPAGVVTTFAGNKGNPGFANGTGAAAKFWEPNAIAFDAAGNLFVAGGRNHCIRKITPDAVVTTVAGSTLAGWLDGTGAAASFSYPQGLCFDTAGNLYITDAELNSTLRKMTPAGVVTTLAGQNGSYSVGSTNATGSAARFNRVQKLAVDTSGNVYAADNGNFIVRKITPAGVVTTLAGTAGFPGTIDGIGPAARFQSISGATADSSGNLYVVDSYKVRKITPTGTVSTIAGGTAGSADGTGPAAQFNTSGEIAVDSAGNLYLADTANNTIRKITSTGVVTTFAGSAGVSGSTNATGSAARFDYPIGITVDTSGNVYVGDNHGCLLRKITAAGVVTTLAGASVDSFGLDGTGTAARFDQITSLCTDSSGNLFATDNYDYTVRKITPAGVVTTVGGAVQAANHADGIGTNARFYNPTGIAVDPTGNLYVADADGNTIRKGTFDGTLAPPPPPPPPSSSSSSSGSGISGGGSPSEWFWCALCLLGLAKRFVKNRRN